MGDTPGPSLVVVVDDEPVLRAGFVTMLQDAGYRTADYDNAETLLATDWAQHAACLLLDAGLPGMNGVALLKQLGETGVRVPVVMITGLAGMEKAVRAMKAGACDFIEKPSSEAAILAAIERAIGRQPGKAAFDTLHLEAARFMERLIARQREVLLRIVDGQANKAIAFELGIGQRTVETHRAAIMRKSGVRSLPALARLVFATDASARPAPAGARPPSVGPPMADATQGHRFERYFEQIPLAVVVATAGTPERVTYANPAIETLSGQSRDEVVGQPWSSLRGVSLGVGDSLALADAVQASSDLVGTFRIDRIDGTSTIVDAFSNIIVDDGPAFRLVSLVDVGAHHSESRQAFAHQVREKDTQLLGIQHRVKNNLQMITALVRIEARKARKQLESGPFDRLAGRIDSIQLVYKLLSEAGKGDEIDLGMYLSEMASAVMHASAVEGIRLEMKVDSFPVSVNVALPTGMVVNELLTNALKDAFVDRDGGTITLQSLTDARGCRVVVADDGVGLPPDISWPKRGKLGAMIVQSLRQNANAEIQVESRRGEGMRVTIALSHKAAAVPASQIVGTSQR